MDVVKPITITESILTSNVPTGDYPTWVAGTYNAGDRVVQNLIIYQATTTTTDEPEVGVTLEVPTWVKYGYINRWRMFEPNTASITSNPTTIDVSVQLSQVATGIALFGVGAVTFTITVTDPVEGVVYLRDVSTADYFVNNWFDYFFKPYEQFVDFVFTDLPPYPNASVNIVFTNITGVNAECAFLGLGYKVNLGTTLHDTSLGTIDYSTLEADIFGNYNIIERKKSKTVDYKVLVGSERTGTIQRYLNSVSTTPVVFIGTSDREPTIVLGYHRDWKINYDNRVTSLLTMTVEGV